MDDRLTKWFENQAEKLSDDDGAATFVRRSGNDALYEYVTDAGDALRGWWRDGESVRDIKWKYEPSSGWTEDLK